MKDEVHHDSQSVKRAIPPILEAAAPPVLHAPVLSALPPRISTQESSKTGYMSLPKTNTHKSTHGKLMGRAAGTIGIVVLIVFGLTAGAALLKQATKRDTMEDYVFLCNNLFGKIKLEGSVLPSDAETEIEAQNSMAEINRISRHGKNLGQIAQGLIYIESQRGEILKNAPNGKALVSGLVQAASGYNSGKNEEIWSGIEKAWPDIAGGANTLLDAMNLLDKKHRLAIILAKCAPQFSGPLTNGSLLNCSFAQHLPGFLEAETVQAVGLVNSSGHDLHNCVIFVRLSDAGGNSNVNLHFAPSWPVGGKLDAKYSSYDAHTTTVKYPTRVDISIWARELSFEPITVKMPVNGWPDPL